MGLIRPKQTGPDAPTTQEMHSGAQMKAPAPEDQPSPLLPGFRWPIVPASAVGKAPW